MMPARLLLCFAVLLLPPAAAVAELSAEAHAFSEVVDRGRSLTDGGAAIGATVSYDAPSGWFAGVGGFYSDDSPWNAAKTRNWNAFLGWFHELDGDRAVEFSVVRNRFVDAGNWDYTELRGNYHLNSELSVSMSWSPDFYGRSADSVIVAGSWRPELSTSAYLVFAGGAGYMTGPWDTGILYAEAGAGYRFGRFDVSLKLSTVDKDSERIFVSDGSTVALRLSYLVF